MTPQRPDEGGSTRPQRVRVTRTRRVSVTGGPSLREEVDAQSALGATYVASLVRAQRRLALLLVGPLALGLLALPLLVLLVPALGRMQVLGLPLPWLVLGVLVYPVVVLAAMWFTRASERLEEQFADVVGPR